MGHGGGGGNGGRGGGSCQPPRPGSRWHTWLEGLK